jgi:hypothetical protein
LNVFLRGKRISAADEFFRSLFSPAVTGPPLLFPGLFPVHAKFNNSSPAVHWRRNRRKGWWRGWRKRKSQIKKENQMNIRKYLGTPLLSVGLLLASGIPAMAKEARTVTLFHDVVLNGTVLPAGKCSVEWQTHSPEASVEFVRHHKVVLATEGRVEERSRTYDRDAVVYNTASNGTVSIVEFRFAKSNKVLLLNQ